MVATSPADGYTLLVVSTGFVVNPSLFAKVPYDPVKDFAPITIVAVSPNVVTVHPSVPAKTDEGADRGHQGQPGQVQLRRPRCRQHAAPVRRDLPAQPSISTCPPYSSPARAPPSNRRVGGHTPVAFSALPPAAPQIKEGLLRALAVTAEKRSKALPDVPTMAEAGIPGRRPIPDGHPGAGGHAEGHHRPAAPEIVTLVAMPDVQASVSTTWVSKSWPIRPTSSRPTHQDEMEKWAKVIRDAKIKPQEAK